MCNDFSCYVTRSHQVVWEIGISSHDQLQSKYQDKFPELRDEKHAAVKVEITPTAGYLHPEKEWEFRVDEKEIPDWFVDTHKKEAQKAHKAWKKDVYALIDLKQALKPINPLSIKRTPNQKDIELLKQWTSVGDSVWASVWASVWDSVWASVWASVGDSVWASVWAYTGSLFDIWGGNYKYQSAVDLWKRGFVPSFDGKTWRLHSGKKAEIVYELPV